MTVIASGGRILGSGAGVFSVGTGVLQAPTNFQMTGQQTTGGGAATFSWSAASGATGYNVYRSTANSDGSPGTYTKLNGSAITGTTYTDSTATNIVTPNYNPYPYRQATVYRYAVSSLSGATESALSFDMSAIIYRGGSPDAWTLASNSFFGSCSINTIDTAGGSLYGTYDVAVTTSALGGYWLPFSGYPFLFDSGGTGTSIHWMEVGAFNYLNMALKPTIANQTWFFGLVSRVDIGDNFNSGSVILGGADATFGPQAQVGVWANYKIPFLNPSPTDFSNGKSLQLGFGQCTGSLNSSNQLIVTANLSGTNVQGSAYLSGGTIVQGVDGTTEGTYVLSSNGTSGNAGTYNYNTDFAQTVASRIIQMQRTNMYKFTLQDNTSSTSNIFYFDNCYFSVN
jgi:hypothetical protein